MGLLLRFWVGSLSRCDQGRVPIIFIPPVSCLEETYERSCHTIESKVRNS